MVRSRAPELDSNHDFLRVVAEDAALGVGDLLCEGFANPGTVDTKRDFQDLVTEYDRLAEEQIVSHLLRRVPRSRVYAEEGGLRGAGEITWYVDPIDGTNNFATQIPFFCVSIGVVYGDDLVAGVVYDPLRDELFSADSDGAQCNGNPIASRGAHREEEACLEATFPPGGGSDSGLDGWEGALLMDLIEHFRTVRRLGSGVLSLAYVAAGRIDVTFGVGANPWDIAAGAMLVEAAGGSFLPLPTGMHSSAPWMADAYLSHVANFDISRTLSPLMVQDGEVARE